MVQKVLFFAAGISLAPTDLAEMYKVNDPTHVCEEEEVMPDVSCGEKVNLSRLTRTANPQI